MNPTLSHTDQSSSARKDGGVSGVSSSCGARGGFLPRHDEDLREPLVRPACKETLAWPSKGPVCLPRPWPTASPWGEPQVCGVGGR